MKPDLTQKEWVCIGTTFTGKEHYHNASIDQVALVSGDGSMTIYYDRLPGTSSPYAICFSNRVSFQKES